jgi:hypothetical protein
LYHGVGGDHRRGPADGTADAEQQAHLVVDADGLGQPPAGPQRDQGADRHHRQRGQANLSDLAEAQA